MLTLGLSSPMANHFTKSDKSSPTITKTKTLGSSKRTIMTELMITTVTLQAAKQEKSKSSQLVNSDCGFVGEGAPCTCISSVVMSHAI